MGLSPSPAPPLSFLAGYSLQKARQARRSDQGRQRSASLIAFAEEESSLNRGPESTKGRKRETEERTKKGSERFFVKSSSGPFCFPETPPARSRRKTGSLESWRAGGVSLLFGWSGLSGRSCRWPLLLRGEPPERDASGSREVVFDHGRDACSTRKLPDARLVDGLRFAG